MSSTKPKLRVMAIHGYRQTDSVFSAKLGSLRKSFKQKIDFHFVRAPHLVPPLDSNNEPKESGTEDAGWWFNTEDHVFKAIEPSNICVGFEDSLAEIEKAFQESGPFDGIIGFSQGGAFAAILCAMQQKKLLSIKFNFAILISGFKSLCKPHEIYYDEKLHLRTLHVYGETDKVIPTVMAKELADLFDNKTVVTHEGGHYIPGKKQIYNEFIDEMLTLKENVQQQKIDEFK
ncbi:esterase OVCA2 [Venturia canescens]|uniref:esterase OVCA2 n=1 Tax=Venturia canescens TaxID=32260 RepID=UPI001C9BBE81|nr:esterase OVCA2 [Venturia canescens]